MRAATPPPAWAIINGERAHGVTWHLMAERVDAGDILVQHGFPVEAIETTATLNAKCYDAITVNSPLTIFGPIMQPAVVPGLRITEPLKWASAPRYRFRHGGPAIPRRPVVVAGGSGKPSYDCLATRISQHSGNVMWLRSVGRSHTLKRPSRQTNTLMPASAHWHLADGGRSVTVR